jgi:hypothetical protein
VFLCAEGRKVKEGWLKFKRIHEGTEGRHVGSEENGITWHAAFLTSILPSFLPHQEGVVEGTKRGGEGGTTIL